MSFSFASLQLDDIAEWPRIWRIAAVAIISSSVLVIGYWFDLSVQMKNYNEAITKHQQLRQEVHNKQLVLARQARYTRQASVIRKHISSITARVRSQSKMTDLLDAISKVGAKNGLAFKLLKPSGEKAEGFYTESAIQIVATGNYHQLAGFVSDLANLSYLITFNRFTIKTTSLGKQGDGELIMSLTAKLITLQQDVRHGKR